MRSKWIFAAALWLLAGCAGARAASFDAVSVKPAPPDAKFSQTNYDPGRLTAHGVNLKQLIEWAYQVSPLQVSGGPGWTDSKFFDVDATAEGLHTKAEILQMLQPVLAERFKLALHHESKQLSVYVLTAAASHPKLEPAPPGRPAFMNLAGVPGSSAGSKDIALEATAQAVSMHYMADYLTGIMDRIVVDRTGLENGFDFKVRVDLEQSDLTTDKRGTITAAMLDVLRQVGLKLEPKKEAVDVLVIDHAEEPSGN